MPTTTTLWIVHRNQNARAALARLAGAGDATFLGSPSDEIFESASAADVVVLAISEDFESELEFAHRFSVRLPHASWILLGEASDLDEARRLFDSLPARFLRYPPQPSELQRVIHEALHQRTANSLSHRRGRDRLAARFSSWFADLEAPDLLRALDPRLSHLPILIRGEAGTGRSLLARYLHTFGSWDDSPLIHVPCANIQRQAELLEWIAAAPSRAREWRRTLWLEDVDRLSAALQGRIRDWIEYGLPEGTLRATKLRWIFSVGEAFEYTDLDAPERGLTRSLEQAISGLLLRIPPLRERAASIESFVADTAAAWYRAQGEGPRRFDDAALEELRGHPWPSNMAELESVVTRSLAHSGANPLEPRHLHFQAGVSLADTGEPMRAAPDREIQRDPPEDQGMRRAGFDEDLRPDTPRPSLPSDPVPPAELHLSSASEHGETHARHDVENLRRFVGALAHEVRNPLVSIKTFSELLPANFDDGDFRERFSELVGADVRRIEAVVAQLQELAELTSANIERVNIASLLDSLLDQHRDDIQARQLLVLQELDRSQPYALGDPEQLKRAFTSLLKKALETVPERGDVYLASKHNVSGVRGGPAVRILLRYHNPARHEEHERPLNAIGRVAGLAPEETSLDFLIAEALIRAQDGSLAVDTTDALETVIVIDLPAPESDEVSANDRTR